MARRGRRRSIKFRLKKKSLQANSAVLLILVGLLGLLSLATSRGRVLFWISQHLSAYFGWAAIFIPLILILAGLISLRTVKLPFVELRVLVGLCFATLSLMGLVPLLGGRGGVVGQVLAEGLRNSFTTVGAFLILFSLGVVSFLVTFNTSLDNLISTAGKVTRAVAAFLRTYLFRNLVALFEKRKGAVTDSPQVEGEAVEEEDRAPAFEIVAPVSEPTSPEKRSSQEVGEVGLPPGMAADLPFSDRVWEYPPLDILDGASDTTANRGDVKANAQTIEKTLESFGIKARVVEVNLGSSVTQYALESAQGTKIAKIRNLQNDLAMALASPTGTIRIEAPIPGKSLIGVEVPNYSAELVTLKSILTSGAMEKSKSKLTVTLGLDVSGKPIVTDIGRMPHMLIAGSTGSGKSVLLHSFVTTLLFRCSPSEVKFIFIDPKRVELPQYNEIPHLLTPVIVDPEKALPSFRWAISEMNRRYRLFENARARNINAYNELSGFQALPYILIVVDELADLMVMAPVEVEKSICRLAQMSRATGIHLILATQRPSVDVLTGLIKANIPCRIAFNVTSQVDSRVIIDQPGAEKLLGRGDMLYVPPDASKPTRIQGAFVSDRELTGLIRFLKQSQVTPEYKMEVIQYEDAAVEKSEPEDSLFDEAVQIVCEHRRASASLLQRRLRIGYARAARILDEMESRGIVSSADGSKPRNVLIREPGRALGGGREEGE